MSQSLTSALKHIEAGGTAVFLDAQQVDSVDPTLAALINAIAQRFRTLHVGTAGFTAPKSPQGRHELIDSGLYPTPHYVDRSWHVYGSKEPELKSSFTRADSEVITSFVSNFSRFFSGLPNLIEGLESTLAELMDNVYAHSGSPDGGWIAAKLYSHERVLRFSVCDLGISIPSHLRKRVPSYSEMPDHEILSEAFVIGVSGDKLTRFGSGLPTVSEITTLLGGSLQVYSGNAIYRVVKADIRSQPVDARFPGTLVSIEWPTLSEA